MTQGVQMNMSCRGLQLTLAFLSLILLGMGIWLLATQWNQMSQGVQITVTVAVVWLGLQTLIPLMRMWFNFSPRILGWIAGAEIVYIAVYIAIMCVLFLQNNTYFNRVAIGLWSSFILIILLLPTIISLVVGNQTLWGAAKGTFALDSKTNLSEAIGNNTLLGTDGFPVSNPRLY